MEKRGLDVRSAMAVEAVSRDDSLDGFSDALMGADDVENIIDSVVAKLGETP